MFEYNQPVDNERHTVDTNTSVHAVIRLGLKPKFHLARHVTPRHVT